MLKAISIISFACISITFIGHSQTVSTVQFQYHNLSSLSQSDSATLQWLKPYNDSIEKYLNTIIGFSLENVYKQKGGGALGNLVTQAMLQHAQTKTGTTIHAAVLHPSSIKGYLAQGNITIGSLTQLLPYNNQLVIVSISGLHLTQFIQQMAADGGWPISGIKYNITLQGNATNIYINNEPIIPDNTYQIVVTDYMKNGNYKCEILKLLPQVTLNANLRESCKVYIESFTNNHEPLAINKVSPINYVYE